LMRFLAVKLKTNTEQSIICMAASKA